jgi:lipopolysaccharide transport system ATP-binding protein
MNDIVVKVNYLSKRFKIYSNPWARALEWVSNGQKVYHRDFWALRNISFELKQGECLGIIGPNGAGKSTLLKILTRSLYPTTGTFRVEGNVLSLLELGTGFNGELTGRQNIYRSSQLLGFPEGYVSERIQEIEEFAEIGEFFDRPIKTYSSGMYVRLAFSMFVFLEPEVLIVDEALSVGDIFFQQKCFAKMREMLSSDTTCLFASHDMAAIQNLCQRAIFLNHGEVDFEGTPEETVSRYFSKISKRTATLGPLEMKTDRNSHQEDDLMSPPEIFKNNILKVNGRRHGAGGLEVVAARVTDPHEKDTLVVPILESLHFYLLLRAKEEIPDPQTGIHLFDRLGNLVFAAGTRQLKHRLPALKLGQEIVVKFEILFSVQPGEYTFSLGASEPSEEGPNIGYIHDRHEMLGPIVVTANPDEVFPFYGIAQLPMKVSFHRPKNF